MKKILSLFAALLMAGSMVAQTPYDAEPEAGNLVLVAHSAWANDEIFDFQQITFSLYPTFSGGDFAIELAFPTDEYALPAGTYNVSATKNKGTILQSAGEGIYGATMSYVDDYLTMAQYYIVSGSLSISYSMDNQRMNISGTLVSAKGSHLTINASNIANPFYEELMDNTITYTAFEKLKEGTSYPTVHTDAFGGANLIDHQWNSTTKTGTLVFDNVVRTIGDEAFYGCAAMQTITIPASVEEIGSMALYECSSLENIFVDANNYMYTAEDGVLFDISKETLIQYPVGNKRTSYTVPNGVVTIAQEAMEEAPFTSVTLPNTLTTIQNSGMAFCHHLTSLTLPASVTEIGNSAFYEDDALTSITCCATIVPITAGNAFGNVSKDIPVYVPNGCVDLYQNATQWKEFTNIIGADLPTALVNTSDLNANANRKVLRNGQLLIIRDGVTYDAQGAIVK